MRIWGKRGDRMPEAGILANRIEMSAEKTQECFAVDPETPLLAGVLAALLKAADNAFKDATTLADMKDSVRTYHTGELNALMEMHAFIKENVKNANEIKWGTKSGK